MVTKIRERLKGWKTVLFNGGLIFVSLIPYLDQSALGNYLPEKYAWIPIVIGAVNIALRGVTTTPVGKKA